MNNQWKKYLFWFAQEHIDFRTAVSNSLFDSFNFDLSVPYNFYMYSFQEIQSILSMFGVNIYTYPKLETHVRKYNYYNNII